MIIKVHTTAAPPYTLTNNFGTSSESLTNHNVGVGASQTHPLQTEIEIDKTPAKRPFYRTRLGLAVIVVVAIFFCAAIVGGAIAGTTRKHTNRVVGQDESFSNLLLTAHIILRLDQNQSGQNTSTSVFNSVYSEDNGIGGYNLDSPVDQIFPFDYDHSGKLDHLVLYRPGTGTIWILRNQNGTFSPVYSSPEGIGGYDLLSPADLAFAFDYDHSGNLDYIALYRPGTGTFWILRNQNGTFSPVYNQGDPGNGIGGYDLASPADLAFAFDYDHSGKLDYISLYRPGTGTFWILQNQNGTFSPVYHEGDPGDGIGGYDLDSPADLAFAFDYDHSGNLDYLALYRPGAGTFWILQNQNGAFWPVYNGGDSGNGIGGYDLSSSADLAFAYDYNHSGKLDHLVLYRPGMGKFWILQNENGTFSPVYQQNPPGLGIGGYNLTSTADRAFAFDYASVGKDDYLTLYRRGLGLISILAHDG
jgi:hypothetical protein